MKRPLVSSACLQFLFPVILQSTVFLWTFAKQKHKCLNILKLHSFLSSYRVLLLFCFLSVFWSFSHPQLTPPSSFSKTNKQCSKLRDEEWLSAQGFQLFSISRQGGKDDKERCWNESSVWARSLFNLSC